MESKLIVILAAIGATTVIGVPLMAFQTYDRFNQSPNAVILTVGPYEVNKKIIFDANKSYDPDGGDIITYSWFFGDGGYARDKITSHEYSTPSQYQITLEIKDDDHRTGIAQDLILVTNSIKNEIRQAPIDGKITNSDLTLEWPTMHDVVFNDNSTIHNGYLKPNALMEVQGKFEEKSTIHFSASRSFDSDGNIVEYIWDYGDGSQNIGKEVNHEYVSEGTYNVILTIKDDSGLSSSTPIQVIITKPTGFLGLDDFTLTIVSYALVSVSIILSLLLYVQKLKISATLASEQLKSLIRDLESLKSSLHDLESLKSSYPNDKYFTSKISYWMNKSIVRKNELFAADLYDLELMYSKLNIVQNTQDYNIIRDILLKRLDTMMRWLSKQKSDDFTKDFEQ